MAEMNPLGPTNGTTITSPKSSQTDDDTAKCGDDEWPWVVNGMCCNIDTDPLILAGGTAVLCCPHRVDCTSIQPFTCDLNKFNPQPEDQSPPQAATIFRGKGLAKCGNGCCIWGYTCANFDNGDSVCVLDEDQSHQPDGNPSTSLTTTTMMTDRTTGSSATSTAMSVPSPSQTPSTTFTTSSETLQITMQPGHPDGEPAQNPSKLGAPAIAGISIGVVGIIALAVGILHFLSRRERRKQESSDRSLESRSRASPSGGDSGKVAELPGTNPGWTLARRQQPATPIYELE